MEIGTLTLTTGNGSIFIQENTKKDKKNIPEKLQFIATFLRLQGYKYSRDFEINVTTIKVYKEKWLDIQEAVRKLNGAFY